MYFEDEDIKIDHVEVWYDKLTKNWVLIPNDADEHQCRESEYVGHIDHIIHSAKLYNEKGIKIRTTSKLFKTEMFKRYNVVVDLFNF